MRVRSCHLAVDRVWHVYISASKNGAGHVHTSARACIEGDKGFRRRSEGKPQWVPVETKLTKD